MHFFQNLTIMAFENMKFSTLDEPFDLKFAIADAQIRIEKLQQFIHLIDSERKAHKNMEYDDTEFNGR